MEQPLKYIINEDPIAWARVRHGKGRFWDSQKQEKLYYGLLISNIHGDRPLYTVPICMDITFFMAMPKLSEKKQQEREGSWHYTRPDLDNLIKFIMDTCTGILYKDDCVVSCCFIRKQYSQNPRVEFFITELK